MVTPDDSSILTRLRTDDSAAARLIFHRYAAQLVALARDHLGSRLAGKDDPEDVVQSVFRSFFTRARCGQFDLPNWNSVWGLLVAITVRKCVNRLTHYRAARRDVGREVGPAEEGVGLDRAPTPEEAAALAETLEDVLRTLTDRDRTILQLHLSGEEAVQIARQVGRSVRTVRRALELVRLRLERMLAAAENAED
jgi:RNA polymerase sigma-70 factor (ECF subfamily)